MRGEPGPSGIGLLMGGGVVGALHHAHGQGKDAKEGGDVVSFRGGEVRRVVRGYPSEAGRASVKRDGDDEGWAVDAIEGFDGFGGFWAVLAAVPCKVFDEDGARGLDQSVAADDRTSVHRIGVFFEGLRDDVTTGCDGPCEGQEEEGKKVFHWSVMFMGSW